MDYLGPFQSGFRPIYGREAALVAFMDDLWQSWDGGGASILDLLDFSAAFCLTMLSLELVSGVGGR